jgi:hypothetical protein
MMVYSVFLIVGLLAVWILLLLLDVEVEVEVEVEMHLFVAELELELELLLDDVTKCRNKNVQNSCST